MGPDTALDLELTQVMASAYSKETHESPGEYTNLYFNEGENRKVL